jgi:hypothetical protein
MDPELKTLIEETHALARENHRLLEHVRRHQIIEFYGKWIIYGVLVIVGGIFYIHFVMPLFDTYLHAVSGGENGPAVLPSGELQKLLESYQSGR